MSSLNELKIFNISLFCVLSGTLAKSKAELELSSTQLREGDDLIITCTITDKSKFEVGRIYRLIEGIPGGRVQKEISSNNGISNALKDRYKNIEYSPGNELTVIKVQITGERISERERMSGRYTDPHTNTQRQTDRRTDRGRRRNRSTHERFSLILMFLMKNCSSRKFPNIVRKTVWPFFVTHTQNGISSRHIM